MVEPLKWFLFNDTYPYPPMQLIDALGHIPGFLDPYDDRPAIEQFNENYQGGWDPMEGFTLIDGHSLKYPGDPVMNPIALVDFHTDIVLVYPMGWVCVLHPDRTFEVARLD
jgi:hypothetical protein